MNKEIFLVICLATWASAYSIPGPVISASPTGIKVSIDGDDGIRLFAFNAKVNKDVGLNEPGDVSGETRNAGPDGRWTISVRNLALKVGDKIHYWIFVQHENLGYRLENQHYEIKEFNKEEQVVIPVVTQPTPILPKCELSNTKVNGEITKCRGEVIFEDNFNLLDYTKWESVTRFSSDVQDAEFCSYQNRSENVFVQGGNLFIVPSLQSTIPGFTETLIRTGKIDFGTKCTADYPHIEERDCSRMASGSYILPPVVSGKVRSKNSFRFRYGTVEVRAKLPKGDWLFPEIYLDSYDYTYGPNYYQSGQIRMPFILGNERLLNANGEEIDGSRLHGNVILSNQNTLRRTWRKTKVGDMHWGNDFHNYTIKWTPDLISFAVDGEIFGTFRDPFCTVATDCAKIPYASKWLDGLKLAPFDREFYLTIGVGVGGNGDFPDACLTGLERKTKPWVNTDPRAELKFFTEKPNWLSTWNANDANLQVAHIKVTAL